MIQSLRMKFLLGSGTLLLILLIDGAVGVGVARWNSNAIRRILRENYDSMVYGQNMKDAVDQIDRMYPGGAANGRGGRVADAGTRAAASQRFERNLAREFGNITIPGERQAAEEVAASWLEYQATARELARLGPSPPTEAQSALLAAESQRVRAAAQRVIDLNTAQMGAADARARAAGRWVESLMAALVLAGAACSVLLFSLVSRSVLRQLGNLTASAREIEKGNLDLVIRPHARDEMGALAGAFNAMAARLREFRRSDEAKIIRTERTTQTAINSLREGVAVLGPGGTVELANQTAERLFRLKPRSPVSNYPWLADLCHAVFRDGTPHEPKGYDGAIQVFDQGRERFFLPHAVPIHEAGRGTVGVTLVLVDVTNLRRLDEFKSNMVATVSHELKTPLTTLRMATHLLLEERVGPLNVKQTELLTAARDNAERLFGMIETLLDMSRIEAGKAGLNVRMVHPAEMVMASVDPLRAAYKDRGVKLEVDLPPDLEPIPADAQRVHHVLGNLLSNALKFTPAGGVVTVRVEPQADATRFSVTDTGVGIPAGHLPRMFERFYRIPGRPGSGAGLGLSIAREIVAAHGGAIQVRSHEGRGSTFAFTLPNTAEARPVETPEDAPRTP